MANSGTGRLALMLSSAIFLGACEEGSEFKLFDKPLFSNEDAAEGEDGAVPASTETTLIERDVEAPDVFQETENGLWDGRPSLGGVWVAHPNAELPERVIIRNQANGKFVIGALFLRERENPGPRFQASADAAEALGMLAGAPAELNVTALRREQVAVPPPASEPALDSAETIETATLDPIASAAASAIDAAESQATTTTAAAPAPKPAPAPAAPPKPQSSLTKPFVQIGIFSIESNAENTADMLRSSGVIPTIKPGTTSGKNFWRVIVGPAASNSERSAIIKKVKSLGFEDAYAVTN